jgi:lipopolysaccharide/colanic/teichoic acid biosynthesis glycosyltransferase
MMKDVERQFMAEDALMPATLIESHVLPDERCDSGVGIDSVAVNRTERALDIVVALLLMVLCSPVVLLILLGMYVCSGPPYLYRGTRLGARGRPFTMYKFRTLAEGAETIVGAQLVSEKHQLTTPWGGFLRETRLDELPQLYNVLRGEMTLIGPRPERPAVAEVVSSSVRNYHFRFTVKPGLTGYAQLYTAHGTPKSIRARIDNRFVRNHRSLSSRLSLMLLTLSVAARSLLARVRRRIFCSSCRGEPSERRVLSRHRLDQGSVLPVDAGTWCSGAPKLRLIDISESAFRARADRPLHVGDFDRWIVEIILPEERKHRWLRRMRCTGTVIRKIHSWDCCEYIVDFKPASDYSRFVLEQYILRRSFASRMER